jgi:predicted O-methyltransferase YrrM
MTAIIIVAIILIVIGIASYFDTESVEERKREEFVKNVEKYKGDSFVNIINSDLFAVDISSLANTVKLFFYDGPHDQESTKAAVEHYYLSFANEAILVFDDANWTGVVEGARAGINSAGAKVIYEKMILNSVENPNEWWNGLYILVIQKQ